MYTVVAGVPNFFPTEFTYNRCEIFDNDATNLLPILTNCIAFIEEGKHFGSVLVHCNKGVSRSCSVIIAYLIKSQGMSKKGIISISKTSFVSLFFFILAI